VTDADVAAAPTEARGAAYGTRRFPNAEHPRRLLDQGIPEHFAHAWSASGIAGRNGWYAIPTHTVQRLTGQPATPIGDWALSSPSRRPPEGHAPRRQARGETTALPHHGTPPSLSLCR
jgi:hypothetical protein